MSSLKNKENLGFPLPTQRSQFFSCFSSFLLFATFSVSFLFPIHKGQAEEESTTSEGSTLSSLSEQASTISQAGQSAAGLIQDEYTKLIVKSSLNAVGNGAMAASAIGPCVAGDIGSCIVTGLASIQAGVAISVALTAKKEKKSKQDNPSYLQQRCNGLPGMMEDCSNESTGIEIPNLPAQLTSNKKKLEKRGYKLQNNQLTLPDGRKVPNDLSEESLKAAGFNEEEVQSVIGAFKKASKKGKSIFQKTSKEFQKDLEDGDDKVKILGTEYRLSHLGFKSSAGRGSKSSARSFSSRKTPSFSSFFKGLQKRGKKGAKKPTTFKASQFHRKFGKDRIGIGVQSIFDLIHTRYQSLRNKKYFH